MNLFDYIDEMEYFISGNESHLGQDNLSRMKMIFLFELIMSALFAAMSYLVIDDFKLNPAYLLPPVFAGLLLKLTYMAERKAGDLPSFRFVRGYAMLCYSCMFFAVGTVELFARPRRCVVLFPIVMVASVAFYVDYFRVVAGYELLASILFLVFDGMVKPKSLLKEDVVLVGAAVVMALFSYFMMLCIQTDTGRGSRELRYKSNTDLLTGLYNKHAFEDEARKFLAGRPAGTPCALFIFDFDNFKHINDGYGHQTGDEVLRYFGFLLHKSFRSNDIVGRVGGDEFMVLMTGAVPGGYIEKRCEDILHAMRGAKVGRAEGFSASIGIAQDAGKDDFQRLYKVADQALYQAKENGKACFVKYHTDDPDLPVKK